MPTRFALAAVIVVAVALIALSRVTREAPPRLAASPRPADPRPGPASVPDAGSSGSVPNGGQALAKATFAGGCFWCMEEAFDKVEGVVSTTSGYTGGHVKNPTYEEVSSGGTGHVEAVEVAYDPARVSYPDLLQAFWKNVDPTTPNRQFCDVGEQYRSAIFYRDETERRLAEDSKHEIERTKRYAIVTEILPATEFYPAEDYHQDYYMKNPVRYKFYKFNCGRKERLDELWGKAE
jgi:peptide-methionine (S)-S-oxide reductase